MRIKSEYLVGYTDIPELRSEESEVYEKTEGYLIVVDVSGIDPNNLSVSVNRSKINVLERIVCTTSAHPLCLTFDLGEDISKVKALLANGILRVIARKASYGVEIPIVEEYPSFLDSSYSVIKTK